MESFNIQKCLCLGTEPNNILNNLTIPCCICSNIYHKSCIKDNLTMRRFICFHCQKHNIDPFATSLTDVLEHPIYLKYNKKEFRKKIEFSHPETIRQIFLKETSNVSSDGKIMAYMLRCIRLDSKGFEYHWPLNCLVYLNNLCFKFEQSKEHVSARSRIDYPIMLFHNNEDRLNYMKRYPENKHCYILNQIELKSKNTLDFNVLYQNNSNDVYSYVVFFDYCALNYDVNQKLASINSINDLSMIQNFLNADEDSPFSSLVSKFDPMTTNLEIKIPGRSIFCLHLEVFDLEIFLKSCLMNKKMKFDCPICKCKASILYKDQKMKEIFEKTKEMSFFMNLEYKVIPKEEKILNNNLQVNRDDVVIRNNVNNDVEMNVIDLCESSSDENEEQLSIKLVLI